MGSIPPGIPLVRSGRSERLSVRSLSGSPLAARFGRSIGLPLVGSGPSRFGPALFPFRSGAVPGLGAVPHRHRHGGRSGAGPHGRVSASPGWGGSVGSIVGRKGGRCWTVRNSIGSPVRSSRVNPRGGSRAGATRPPPCKAGARALVRVRTVAVRSRSLSFAISPGKSAASDRESSAPIQDGSAAEGRGKFPLSWCPYVSPGAVSLAVAATDRCRRFCAGPLPLLRPLRPLDDFGPSPPERSAGRDRRVQGMYRHATARCGASQARPQGIVQPAPRRRSLAPSLGAPEALPPSPLPLRPSSPRCSSLSPSVAAPERSACSTSRGPDSAGRRSPMRALASAWPS
jgi:hypothetical protein